MNYYLLSSGVLTILLAVAHSIIGERSIIGPIQKTSGLPRVQGSDRQTKLTLRFTWHVTSVLGIGTAVVLIAYSRWAILTPDQVFIARALSATYLTCFVISIIGSRAKHPSWIIFALVSVLTWMGTVL
jgi:hypothetical protein